jgi:exonuclease SbcD
LKILITADTHLTSAAQERILTLERLLKSMLQQNLNNLIIAGDCFDAHQSGTGVLDRVLSKSEYRHLQIFLIPGNHDAQIRQAHFSSQNIRVFSEPELMQPDRASLPILLLPYQTGKTMGDLLAEWHDRLKPGAWILIGHGDWSDGLRSVNPFEPGVYMPLTRTDIDMYQPSRVILGHIHKPTDSDPVHYPGSPCPLDINETGKRRSLILDTETGSVEAFPVESERIHFIETFVVIPEGNEWERVEREIRERIATWQITKHERGKVQVRIRFKGFTTDKAKLAELARSCFQGFSFYDEDILMDEVAVAEADERLEIVTLAEKEVAGLDFVRNEFDPPNSEIRLAALKTIYGVE